MLYAALTANIFIIFIIVQKLSCRKTYGLLVSQIISQFNYIKNIEADSFEQNYFKLIKTLWKFNFTICFHAAIIAITLGVFSLLVEGYIDFILSQTGVTFSVFVIVTTYIINKVYHGIFKN